MKFRFQRLLDIKVKREEELKRRIAQLQRVLVEERRRLQMLREKKTSCGRRLVEHKFAGRILEILIYHSYMARLDAQEERIEKRIEELEENLRQRQQEAIEASKERRMFERLKEYEEQEAKQRELAQMQKLLDEAGLRRSLGNYLRGEENG